MPRRTEEITITRLYDGSYECSAIHRGVREHFRYFGYTKKECVRMFRKYLKTK